MEERYLRNIPALTEVECSLLQQKKVAVIGCGGLGGHLVEHLARIGIGTIRCIDGDRFDASNLNRQILSEESFLGMQKAAAAVQRISRINSGVTTECFPVFLTEDNASEILSGCDAILDGLDNITTRRLLSRICGELGIPYVYGAISGWVAQAAISLPGDGLIDRLYPNDTSVLDKSVLSFTPALCAAMQTALCVKLLTGRPIENGQLYYFDLSEMEFESLPML